MPNELKENALFGVVVIGRNEGDRLKVCLRSLVSDTLRIVYVDSGSTDQSIEFAQSLNISCVQLDVTIPFTAARARNKGFEILTEKWPDTQFVQFVDGDCEIVEGWLETAAKYLVDHSSVVAVCGRLRERFPERSVYNRLCDAEWNRAIGQIESCGGVSMMRISRFKSVGGFKSDMVAGEEAELCARLSSYGTIWRLSNAMALHDAAMLKFSQWWMRCKRGGFGYADTHALNKNKTSYAKSENYKRLMRPWFWYLFLPTAVVASTIVFGLMGLFLLAIYPLQILRSANSAVGSKRERLERGSFLLLGKLPELAGQIQHARKRSNSTQTSFDYKASIIQIPESSLDQPKGTQHIAYLINQYPAISHTFIKREIQAIERHGVKVSRFALRGWDNVVVDAEDEAERLNTKYLVNMPTASHAIAIAKALCASPVKFFSAATLALSMSRSSDKNLIFHLVYVAEACTLLSLLKNKQVTHLHAHFATNATEVAALTYALGGPPYSFTAHGSDIMDRPAQAALDLKVQHAKFVAAVCSFGRNQIFRWIPTALWPKVNVIRCGLEPHYAAGAICATSHNSHLVCIGRLSKEKGQILLIEAAAYLSKEGITVPIRLVGDGPMREEIMQLIKRHNLGSHIQMTGWLDAKSVEAELSLARALVVPSLSEGLPVVIMEAMANKRPVIAPMISGIPELVTHEHTGWLFPASDVLALATAIKKCLSSSDAVLDIMGNHCQAAVRLNHHIDKETQILLKLMSTQSVNSREALDI
jgi:glycosyltransferase involved in cell wall biosynthesis